MRAAPSSWRNFAMISVIALRVQREELLLELVHLGLPLAPLLVEADRGGVIRDRHVGADRPGPGPLLEHRMDGPELALVLPERLQHGFDHLVGEVLTGGKVAVVGAEARVSDDRGRRAGLPRGGG